MSAALSSFRSLLPSREDYSGFARSWRSDLLAGLTVGIVALPLALAFGVSSGVGPEAGLITAIIAGLVAAVFGGSHVQVSGPTGAMVVVLAPIVVTHGVHAIATVSLMAGVIVLLLGVLRFGRVVTFIPWPVIEGFTAGIGVIIFTQQIPAAFGSVSKSDSLNAIVQGIDAIGRSSWPAALMPLAAVGTVALIMLLCQKFIPALPGSFIAIIVVTLITVGFNLPLASIGELPSTLPAPHLPSLDPALLTALIGPAFAVAALAAIESLLSARVAATLADTGQVHSDRELVGQGLASLAAGFFGGMPATGAIARTAVNVRSGAKTRAASIIHALVLLCVVLFASTIVSRIPLAALSGVLMMTAARMVSPAIMRRVFRSGRGSAITYLVTLLVTVVFDLVIAVVIGLVVAGFFALRALSTMSEARREKLPGDPLPGDEQIAQYRLYGSLFFGASERILETIAKEPGVKVVILGLSQVQLVDSTGARALAELITTLERRGITVLIKGVRPEHRALMRELGVIESLRVPEHLFAELTPALEHARGHIARARDEK